MFLRIVTFDLEIKTPIPEKGGKPDWGYARAGKCGIASVVLYDSKTERYHVYDENTLDACMDHLNAADRIVGYNSFEFDRAVLENISGRRLTAEHVDLFQVFKAAVNMAGGGWRLGQVCSRTVGLDKTGEGASAPSLFAQGRFAELIDYNINDVHLTRTLYNHILTLGYVIAPDGSEVPLELYDRDDWEGMQA